MQSSRQRRALKFDLPALLELVYPVVRKRHPRVVRADFVLSSLQKMEVEGVLSDYVFIAGDEMPDLAVQLMANHVLSIIYKRTALRENHSDMFHV